MLWSEERVCGEPWRTSLDNIDTQRHVGGNTREVYCGGEYMECRGEQRSMDACSEGMWLWRAPQPSTEQACVHGGALCD